MARTDAIVLGGGIVGVSIALQLAKRGMSVALVERAGIGEQTSYGNSGVIEGSTVLPPAFPSSLSALARVALKRASEANYHMSFLPKVAPWLLAFRAASRADRIAETSRLNRPLFARAVGEHEPLLQESGAPHYLRKTGWMKLYRSEQAFDGLALEFELAREYGLPVEKLDADGARKLEPSLNPVFKRAVFWPAAASLSNPLAVTQAYAARFAKLGGVMVKGDARTLHRSGSGWRVETDEGGIDSSEVIVALGPVGAGFAGTDGPQIADGGQARLSPAFQGGGWRDLVAAGGRCRQRVSDHADGAGHSPDHRRRIRGPRRGADAGSDRSADAGLAWPVSDRCTRRR